MQLKRDFIIGEEWIYYKIYCGNRTSDSILAETVKPLVKNLLNDKVIDKWFFIRYIDPDNHIRIRFHCPELSNLIHVIEEFKNAIKPHMESGLVWNIKLDTYQREMERYGKANIINSEDFFFVDSMTCINALDLIQDDEILFLFALKSIDAILSMFELNTEEKVSFSKKNNDSFRKEFKVDKKFSKKLNLKYQITKNKLEQFMSQDIDNLYLPLTDILKVRDGMLKPVISKINNPDFKLVSSYVHMTINRLFRDKQRLHELVCYDFLYRYYNVVNAKNKTQKIEV